MSDLYFMQLNTHGLSIEHAINWKWGLSLQKVQKKTEGNIVICTQDGLTHVVPENCKEVIVIGHVGRNVSSMMQVSTLGIALSKIEDKYALPIFGLLDLKTMKEFIKRADNGYCYKLANNKFVQQKVSELLGGH